MSNEITKHLGQKSEYKSTYDKSLLVGETRAQNRKDLIGNPAGGLPFVGYDVWNAYECSFLLLNGLPVAGILKIVYNANSPRIVESKSLKLYLNSYNMEKFGDTVKHGVEIFEKQVLEDLQEVLECDDVKLHFFQSGTVKGDEAESGAWGELSMYDWSSLEQHIDTSIKFETFQADKELLKMTSCSSKVNTQLYRSALLKSNCKVTGQPDWGDICIYYKSNYNLNPTSLLQYIVSFRDERNFHERICEQVYMALWEKLAPKDLFVMCNYTRRGGIDINPIRASSSAVLNRYARQTLKAKNFWIKTDKQ